MMAKNVPTPPASDKAAAPKYSEDDVEEMEKLAIDNANKAISAIEKAVAVWDATKQKPSDLQDRVEKLKFFYDQLTKWETGVLRNKGSDEPLEKRVERLREYTQICFAYS
jgi:hypothetical protein